MELIEYGTGFGIMIWQVLLLITIGIWVYALIDILKNPFEKNDKISWLLVVLLIPFLGSILYILMGSKNKLKPN